MIPLGQVCDHVVRPALITLDMWDKAGELLVIGTGLIESNYDYIAQVKGPALGPFQMEPVTAQDIWDNFLAYKTDLRMNILKLMAGQDQIGQLAWNWQYAAAMCRIKYLRSPVPLPAATDLTGLANMWKQVYNTSLGAGDSQLFITRATNAGLLSV